MTSPEMTLAAPTRNFEAETFAGGYIRTHHAIGIYTNLLESIVKEKNLSLEVIANNKAIAMTRTISKYTTDDTMNLGESFFSQYGDQLLTTDDVTIAPNTYFEDAVSQKDTVRASITVGTSIIEYFSKNKRLFLKFLTDPSDSSVVLGQNIDAICKNCYFGNGQGGLHCRADNADLQAAEVIRLWTDTFLEDPRVVLKRQEDPERYVIQNADANSDSSSDLQFTMPLGLLRDAITYHITGGAVIQYEELLESKDLPLPSNSL